MSLNPDARTDAIYNALAAADPNWGQLSAAEKASVRQGIKTTFAADLAYLLANTVVQPATMQAPAGATVSTTGSPSAQTGATTSSVAITGTGTIS